MGGSGEARVVGKPTDGLISRYINRKISTRITLFIVKHNIPITPNQVSAISFLLAIATLPLYLHGYLIPAGILVQLSSIIDGVDGELARARGMVSKKGSFVDTMLDRYADLSILIALMIYLALTNYPVLHIVVLGSLALSGDLLVSYLHTRAQYDFGVHPALIGYLDSIGSRDVRLFIIFIGSILGYIDYTLLSIAVLTHLYIIIKCMYILAL